MDPLVKLKDIQLPDAIPTYPIAIGWWLLLLIIGITLVLSFKYLKRYRASHKIKKQALTQLRKAPQMSNAELVALLKWVCLHYFPRSQVAYLYGIQFQQFLMSVMPDKQQAAFEQHCATAFNELYQLPNQQAQTTTLHAAAKLWLTTALPPSSKPAHIATNEHQGGVA